MRRSPTPRSPSIRSRLHSFGFDKPTIPWATFGEHLEFLSDVGHTPNFAWFVGHNAIRLAAGRVRAGAERRADGGDGGLRPRGDAVGSARDVDRARVQPGPGGDGRGADAAERRRRGVRRDLHEPHPEPRLGPARGDRRVPRRRPGREHASGDLAPQRPPQHERARAGLGAGGREDGGEPRDGTRRPRRHDSVPRGPRPDGRDPAAVGGRGRAGGRGGEAPRPGAPRADAERERPLLALHPQGRVGARVLPGDPRASRARRAQLPADLGAARQGPVGVLPRHPRRRRRGLRVDPHGRDALHRRAPGGDDRPSALLPRRRHVHGPGHGAAERDHEAPARLRRARPLPHPPRARAGHACAWRRQSGR